MEEYEKVDLIKNIDDVDESVLELILRAKYKASLKVSSFSYEQIESAILSIVYSISIKYDRPEKTIPKGVIMKFQKPGLMLSDIAADEAQNNMIDIEFTFYKKVSKKMGSVFCIPTLISGSKQFIMIDRIENIETYSLMEGCPEKCIEPAICRLGKMHAKFWKNDCSGLWKRAGIGSNLDGMSKASMFFDAYEVFLSQLNLGGSEINDILKICQQIDAAKIIELDQKLHHNETFWTMIHGDFHVGNMLFQNSDIYLLDWATCGKGNPLRDLAFFLIVSCTFWTKSVKSNRIKIELYLKLYYESLNQIDLSYKDCEKCYFDCVLNQFIILVCFDEFCHKMAKDNPDLLKHFENTRIRCCHALLEAFSRNKN